MRQKKRPECCHRAENHKNAICRQSPHRIDCVAVLLVRIVRRRQRARACASVRPPKLSRRLVIMNEKTNTEFNRSRICAFTI